MADNLTGDHWVRVFGPALRECSKWWPRARDRMEIRRHALKLRFWPQPNPTDENGVLLDLDWEWIRACKGKDIGELRIHDVIGGCDNIRVIFFVGGRRNGDRLPTIWVLAVLQKKRDEWTKANLVTLEARRRLILERFYSS